MSSTLSNLFSNLPVIDVRVGKPSLPNLIGEELIKTYGVYGEGVAGEGVHDYPLDRQHIIIPDGSGGLIDLGKGNKPLDLSMRDAFATLQPQVTRSMPPQEPAFIPAAGLTGAHYTYVSAMKWALDTFNRLNAPYYEEAKVSPLVGGMVMNETTFSYFVRHLRNTNLEYIQVEQHQDENWAMHPAGLANAMAKAHDDNIFPLGLTSISPDAPIHNIRDRPTTLGLYKALEQFNEERRMWLIQQSGGDTRFEALKASSPEFADAVAILVRPKIFDDPVYLSTEMGPEHTCLFAQLHDEVPAIVDDLVTGISLSKIGMAGARAGAMFVFNEALAKHVRETLDISVEGLNYSAFMPLTLLHAQHPKNAAFRQSIIDYGEDLYRRSAYFSALHQTALGKRIPLRTLSQLNRLFGTAKDPITGEALTFGAIPGVQLLERNAAGYFSNIHFDMRVWGKVLDAYHLPHDPSGIHQLLSHELKILLTPIDLKDRDGKPMAVFRMNCHTSFDNLTGIYARLRHMAQRHDIKPASIRHFSMLQSKPTGMLPLRPAPSIAADMTRQFADDVA